MHNSPLAVSNNIMSLCWDSNVFAMRFFIFSFFIAVGCAFSRYFEISICVKTCCQIFQPHCQALHFLCHVNYSVMPLGNDVTAGLSPHISRKSSKYSEISFPLPDLDPVSTAFLYLYLSSLIFMLTLL